MNNINFEEAWENEDNQKIMNSVARKFRRVLDQDEIESCKKIGLWKAIKSFDESRNIKFTTFLYKGIYFEYKSRSNSILKGRENLEFCEEYGNYETDPIFVEESEMIDSIKKIEDGRILYDEYYLGMSVTEIANKNNETYYETRKKRKIALDKLKLEIVGV